ncbi:MAG: type II toxin-antitoxin system VapC family toxin [Roseiflexaceae bacterium]
MPSFYADSSVLIKRHIREVGTDWVQALADPAIGNAITTARVSIVEVWSALNRRAREGNLAPSDYTRSTVDFAALSATEYTLIDLTAGIATRAQALLERHPLRAYDAVQLASALFANDLLIAMEQPALTFLCADDRLLNAAQAEGLAIDNPNSYG